MLEARLLTPEEIEAREKRPRQIVFVLDLDEEVDSYSIVSYGHWYPIYTQGKTVKEALAMAIDFMECEEDSPVVTYSPRILKLAAAAYLDSYERNGVPYSRFIQDLTHEEHQLLKDTECF